MLRKILKAIHKSLIKLGIRKPKWHDKVKLRFLKWRNNHRGLSTNRKYDNKDYKQFR